MNKKTAKGLYNLIIGLLCLVWADCAGPRYIKLLYPPATYEAVGYQPEKVIKLAKPQIIILKVVDKRQAKDRIGKVKNSYGKELGNILAINDPLKWIADGVKTELEKRRYILFDSSATIASDSIPVITIDLNELYCNAHWIYEGHVRLTARMMLQDDSTIITKTYTGAGSAGENFGGKEQYCAKTLSLTLLDAANQLANDMYTSFIHKYISSGKQRKTGKDTISARSVAYKRGQSHSRGNTAARAAAIAKAARFKQIAASSRTTLHSKSGVAESSKSLFHSMAEKLSGLREMAELNDIFEESDKALEELCQQYRLEHPKVTGEMSIELTINAQGRVISANIIKASLKDTVLHQQIVEKLSVLSFPEISFYDDVTLILYHIAVGEKAGLTEKKEIKISLIVFATLLSIISLIILSRIE